MGLPNAEASSYGPSASAGRSSEGSNVASVSQTLVLWRNRVLVDARTRTPYVVSNDADAFGTPVPIEDTGSAAYVELDPAHDGLEQVLPLVPEASLRFVDPMFELGRATGEDRHRLVRALAIARWSEATRFCSACGEALRWHAIGRTKICRNGHQHWPRLDPSAIMLVSDGERILLGRQATWPAGMYSTLAGFVEAGESVEAAVAREVLEESGIVVGKVTYVGSEPWPFPRSLMLGFVADATTTEIVPSDELEDVRWFTYEEALAIQGVLAERMPHADTIARRLIATWLTERGARIDVR